MLKSVLKRFYDIYPFSVGTHCTQSEETAEEILNSGLKEFASRKLEGAMYMHGDLLSASEEQLTKNFQDNNFIAVVAVPSVIGFEAKGEIAVGGDTITNEFSVLFQASRHNHSVARELGMLTDNGLFGREDAVVPPKFILGYYNLNNDRFVPNPKSMYSTLERADVERETKPYVDFLDKNFRSKDDLSFLSLELDSDLSNVKFKEKDNFSDFDALK